MSATSVSVASATVAPSASAAPFAIASGAPVGACTVSAPVTAGDVALQLAGTTPTVLPDGRLALGSAVGDPNGRFDMQIAQVLVFDSTGQATRADEQWHHVRLGERRHDGETRTVLRVTPLGFVAGTKEMRVAIDMRDATPTSKTIRCGPADVEPWVTHGSHYDSLIGDGDLVDCRTFTNGHVEVVLASVTRGDKMSWIVAKTPGKTTLGDDVVLDEKPYTNAQLAKPDPLAYQVVVGAGVDTGFVFAARQEGALVIARISTQLDKVGEAVRFGFAVPATMPSLAALGRQVSVFVGLNGKMDVLGATFASDTKPPRPQSITIDDPSPPSGGDRSSISSSYTPSGNIFLAFVDGVTGSKKARMTVLGGDLKSRVPVFDIAAGDVTSLRVVATADDRAMVTYLASGVITASVVTCK